MKTKNLLVIILCLILFVSLSNAQTWRQTNGPRLTGCSNLAAHPNGDLYAAKDDNGLIHSVDIGDSWNIIGFTDQRVDKIFIANSGYIFLQVFNSQTNETNVFRSTDNGTTWNQLFFSYSDPGCFADDGIGNIYLSFKDGSTNNILRSTDEGNNWVLWSQFNQGIIQKLLFYDNNNYIFLMSIETNKIYRLINNNWVEYVVINDQTYITSIEVTHNGILLAGSKGPYWITVKGILRSSDNGLTWQRVYSNNIENRNITSIAVNSAGILFTSTSRGVYKSTDDGASWNQIGLQCSQTYDVVCVNEIFTITGGLHRWNDLLNIWEFGHTNFVSFVYNSTFFLAFDQINQDYFAATVSGVFRTSNEGETWDNILPLYTNFWFKIFIDGNPNYLYANGWDWETITGKLYRSPDRGVTWELLDFPVGGIYALMTTSIPGEIWCGSYYGNIHYSSDYGVSWAEKFSVPSAITCLQSGNIQGYMFAGTASSGFYRSTDSGNTWREFNIGLLNYSVESVAMNSTHDIFIGTQDGIYRSTDLAGNWQFVGLSQDTISAIAINSLDYILAGTLSGHIYISRDHGENWIDYSWGLNADQILSIVLDENDFAMVGTSGSGVYRSFNSTVDIRESDFSIVTSFELFQNFPNPFNPSTKIKYSVPQTSQVQIKVFDVLGNEIVTLVSEEKVVGIYEMVWNAANLPSGVYFYQLKAGEYVNTKKMILLK